MPFHAEEKSGTQKTDTLFYQDPQPSGKPGILLLHGLGANSASWQMQLPLLLKKGFRPIAPDLPGFGQSSYTGSSWSIRSASRSVAALLQRLNSGQIFVTGISMGGTVALQLALDYPELVDKLVLVSCFARLRPRGLRGWLYFLKRAILVLGRGMESQAQYVANRIFPHDGQTELRTELIKQIMQANPRVYKQAMRSLGLFNVQKRLGEIKIPTLVITGSDDSTVPVANQCVMANRIKGSRQVIVPNAGHALIIDHMQVFNDLLIDFIAPK